MLSLAMCKSKIWSIVFPPILCVTGAFLNVGIHLLTTGENLLPLYLDTIFTISVTLLIGPVWGCLTGVLTNIIGHTNNFWGWEGYLFALCNIATALVTWMFMRLFPKELSIVRMQAENVKSRQLEGTQTGYVKSRQLDKVMNLIFVLTLLSFALCLVISILGGLISVFIEILRNTAASEPVVNPASPPVMFYNKIPLVLREILSRIPINIIDRLISAFAGYGVAKLVSAACNFVSSAPTKTHQFAK